MKTCHLFICLIWLPAFAFCQSQSTLDSLYSLLPLNKRSEKIETLIEIVRAHADISYDSALVYAFKAKELSYSLRDTAKIIQVHRIIGQLYNRMSMGNKAEDALNQLLWIPKKHFSRDEEFKISNNLAIAYSYQGKYAESLKSYLRCLVLANDMKDSLLICMANMNIGLLFLHLDEPGKAIEYSKKALKPSYQKNRYYASLIVNIGLAYAALEKFDEAQRYFNDALNECKHKCLDDVLINIENGLGVIEFKRERYLLSEQHFENALSMATKIGDIRLQGYSLLYLGRILIKKKIFFSAISEIQAAEQLVSSANNLPQLHESYFLLAEAYCEVKDYAKAATYHKKYISLNDSIMSSQVGKKLALLEVEFFERENKAKMEIQENVLTMQNELIEIHRFVGVGFVIIAILLTWLLFNMYSNLRQKNITNQILDKKVKERTKVLQDEISLIQQARLIEVNSSMSAFQVITDDLASLQGLCEIAGRDISDPVGRDYLEKLEQVLGTLNRNVNALRKIRS